jgi:hypothetical protein
MGLPVLRAAKEDVDGFGEGAAAKSGSIFDLQRRPAAESKEFRDNAID